MHTKPTLPEFIYLGLRKEGWPHTSVETVQMYLDSPDQLDDMPGEFPDRFFYYHSWYWRNQRSK